ncbi:MAG: hypothetical protein L3J53_07640 [Proteobacteria bacterium]|nr:hypothetical protein [Pseudomonadota bacterium]
MQIVRLLFILALLANIWLYIYGRQNQPEQVQFVAVDKGVKKLILLSELDVNNTLWEEKKPTPAQHSKPAKIFNQQCYTVGVFNAKSEIRPILDALKNVVIKTRIRKVTSTHEAGYRVFIPSSATREEALNIARQLSEYYIKDYYVVTGGENENTISLGVYRDKNNANARVQELKSKGFNAEKQARIEQWPEFWLDYAIASDRLQDLVDVTNINPDVSTNKGACNW